MDKKTVIAAIASFAVGCGSGAVAAWIALKSKYQKYAEDEIAEMREHYAKKKESTEKEEAEAEEKDENVPFEATPEEWELYSSLVAPYHDKPIEEREASVPRIVPEEEFGELEDYSIVCLTYFADGVLGDEFNEPFEDPEGTVGEDALRVMESGADDLVFVCNDRIACYFEIAADVRRYRDILEDRDRP